MANSVDSNGSVNNNIYFSMGVTQPSENDIGGIGGKKMRLIISSNNTAIQKTIDVAGVLANQAGFWDKASELFGFSKRVTIQTAEKSFETYLLNINSVVKRLGINRDQAKELTGETIRKQAQSKLYPPTQPLHTQPLPTQPLHTQPPPNSRIRNIPTKQVPDLKQFSDADHKDKASIFDKLPYETKKELITIEADHFDYIPSYEQLGIFRDLSPDTQKKIVSKFPQSILYVEPNSISAFINDLSIDNQAAIIEAIPKLFNLINDSNKKEVFLKLQNAKFQVIANNLENPRLKITQSNPEFGVDEFTKLDPSDKIKVINLNFAFCRKELFSQLLPKTQANIIDAVYYDLKLELFDLVSDARKSDIIGKLMDLETGITNSTINALIRERPNCFENYPNDPFKQSLFNMLSQDVQGILIRNNPNNKQYLPESDRRQ